MQNTPIVDSSSQDIIYLVFSFIESKDKWVKTYAYGKKHFRYLWWARLYRFIKKKLKI